MGVPNTDWKVTAVLEKRGRSTIVEIAKVMRITRTAVREHLMRLMRNGVVGRKLVIYGRGRPHHHYFLVNTDRD